MAEQEEPETPFWTKDQLVFAICKWDDDNVFDSIIFDHEKHEAQVTLRKYNEATNAYDRTVTFTINGRGE